ncbi:MAG TPA: DUF2062 domain-containing protein [Alphaproteobacteria bacterium]|nr:DUF2062 domain-containing protein [Alphaproteobacteria bacterium]USO05052.1 MAG: DUF2062 domain-containing protein [Rhodospirillales bacterium]HOO81676.1 DUF2062 domain-containing protein [Alphaproteobacteria bacterium]
MFKRRTPRTVLQNIRELFWPSMGWVRAAHYTKHRVVRLSDSTQKIAFGLAIGVAISFTPILGTHFVQAGFLAYVLRANFLAALIGTFAGNPWTFPFMWWAAISLGSFIFQLLGLPAEAALPEHADFWVIWDLIKSEPYRIFAPWFVGGYLLGALTVPLTYSLFYRLVGSAQAARKKARENRLHKVAREVTGQKK